MAVNLALKLQDEKDPKRRTEEERSIRDASAVAYAGKHESLFYYIATYLLCLSTCTAAVDTVCVETICIVEAKS
jgi:hypothetical protein